MLTDHIPAQSGDAAMDAFLTACVPVAATRARYILGRDSHMVDDAVQETLIKIWRNLHRYADGNLTGWIVRITTNVCYDILRYQRRHPTDCIDDLAESLVDDYNPLDSLLRNEQQEGVRRAVTRLKECYRVPVELVYLYEMEYVDAAARLGLPMGTLKSRVHRGKTALGEMLVKEGTP